MKEMKIEMKKRRIIKVYCYGNHESQQPIITQSLNLSVGDQVGITRELNMKSLLNCYSIYISYTWSMLPIITLALIFMHHL